MRKFVGLGDRIGARLRVLGYRRGERLDVLRFCTEKAYRPQYVYAWLKDRVPTHDNLRRLAADLQVSMAWIMFGTDSADEPSAERAAERAAEQPAATATSRLPSAVLDLRRVQELTGQLVQLEAELHAIFRAFPDGYFWLDREGAIVSYRAGRGFEALVPTEGVVGKRIHELLTPSGGPLLDAIARALETNAAVATEYTVPERGEVHTFEARFIPLPGSAEQPGLLAIVRNITERKRTEDATGALVQVSHELAGTLDLAQATDRIVAAVVRLFRVRGSALYRVEPATRRLVCVAAAGVTELREAIGKTLPMDTSIAGLAVVENRPVWSSDVFADARVTLPGWAREVVEKGGVPALVSFPLTAQGQPVGAITLADARGRRFGEGELRLLAAFADGAALAIQNAELYATAERRRRAAESLAVVGRSLSQSLDPNEVGQRITEAVFALFHGQAAALYRLEPVSGDLVLMAYSGGSAAPLDNWNAVLPSGAGVAGLAVRERRPVVVSDVLADPRVRLAAELRAKIERGPLRSALAVPLLAQDQVIGVLSFADFPDRRFLDEETSLVQAFADHAVIALENARLYAEAERRRQTAESLAELGRLLSQSLDREEVAQRIADSVHQLLGAVASRLVFLRPDGMRVVLAASGDLGPGFLKDLVTRHTGLSDLAMATRRPAATADLLDDPRLVYTSEQAALVERAPYRTALAVPLVVRDRVIGALVVYDRPGRVFDEEATRLVQTFADQAALALENARLYADARRRREAAETVAELARVLSQSLDPEEVALRTARSVLALLGAHVSTLFRLEPKSGNLVVLANAGGCVPGLLVLPSGTGVAGAAIRERCVVASADVLSDARVVLTPAARAWIEQCGFRSAVAVPLVVRDRVLGVLAVGDTLGRLFEPDEVQALQTFADQAALALENARLYADARRRRETAESLAELARLLSQSLNPSQVAQRIADQVLTLLHARTSALYQVEPASGNLVSLAHAGDHGALRSWQVVLPAGAGVSGLAVQERRPVTTPDALTDERFTITPEMHARAEQAGFGSVVAIPLIVRDRVLGVLTVGDRQGRVFTEDEVATVQAFADQAGLALEHAQLLSERPPTPAGRRHGRGRGKRPPD